MNTPIQIYGYQALERIAVAPAFNKWMFQTIEPFINGKILEIGSGIGNLSKFFVDKEMSICLSDYDPDYINILSDKFPQLSSSIIKIDLSDPDFEFNNLSSKSSFDSIFLLNVLEHIEDDNRAVRNCIYLLKPGGTLLILVPSYSLLFSKMDVLLGHFRRYTKRSISDVLKKNGMLIRKTFYFNALGLAGWLWNKIFNNAEISETKMSLFNKLVPFAKILDKLTFHQLGLSTIAVASKPHSLD